MRAAVRERFGPPQVVEVREVEKPVPADGELLVRVHACSLNMADWYEMSGRPWIARAQMGLRRPKGDRIGTDYAGTVEAVGADVTDFAPGDEVFGTCNGALAEYACAREDKLLHKPKNLTFEQAAAIPTSASTALQALRDQGKVQPGQRVLVIGAGGGVGLFAVQLAKAFGAHVTGVCSTSKVDLVRSVGADDVIDYTRQDFTKSGETWDIVFDTVGKSSFSRCKPVLSDGGCFVATTGLHNYLLAAWTRLRGGKRVITGMSVDKNDALPVLKRMIEAGELRIVIDRRYTLDEIVDAHRYVDSGRKRGNVVVTVQGAA